MGKCEPRRRRLRRRQDGDWELELDEPIRVTTVPAPENAYRNGYHDKTNIAPQAAPPGSPDLFTATWPTPLFNTRPDRNKESKLAKAIKITPAKKFAFVVNVETPTAFAANGGRIALDPFFVYANQYYQGAPAGADFDFTYLIAPPQFNVSRAAGPQAAVNLTGSMTWRFIIEHRYNYFQAYLNWWTFTGTNFSISIDLDELD